MAADVVITMDGVQVAVSGHEAQHHVVMATSHRDAKVASEANRHRAKAVSEARRHVVKEDFHQTDHRVHHVKVHRQERQEDRKVSTMRPRRKDQGRANSIC